MTELIILLIAAWLAFEAKAWFPRLIDKLIRLAARHLPSRYRARYTEEWRAHVEQTPGAAKRLWVAIGFCIAANKMFPELAERRKRIQKRRRGVMIEVRVARLYSAGMLGAAMYVGIFNRIYRAIRRQRSDVGDRLEERLIERLSRLRDEKR